MPLVSLLKILKFEFQAYKDVFFSSKSVNHKHFFFFNFWLFVFLKSPSSFMVGRASNATKLLTMKKQIKIMIMVAIEK
jgi:hypothetical protein